MHRKNTDTENFIFGVIFFACMLALTAGMSYFMGKTECNAKANVLGYKHEYHYWTGCVLEKPDGKKVLLKQLRDYND